MHTLSYQMARHFNAPVRGVFVAQSVKPQARVFAEAKGYRVVEVDYDGDFEIRRYIQDRTVIEDTESTVDLAFHGWTLKNYPERLAFSATPPDFGSLLIQRVEIHDRVDGLEPILERHVVFVRVIAAHDFETKRGRSVCQRICRPTVA